MEPLSELEKTEGHQGWGSGVGWGSEVKGSVGHIHGRSLLSSNGDGLWTSGSQSDFKTSTASASPENSLERQICGFTPKRIGILPHTYSIRNSDSTCFPSDSDAY